MTTVRILATRTADRWEATLPDGREIRRPTLDALEAAVLRLHPGVEFRYSDVPVAAWRKRGLLGLTRGKVMAQ